jgi:hypothetical protein
MAEVIVSEGDEGGGEIPLAEQSAHVAAVAEGATAVQAGQAAESADEAKMAAEVALAAAQANAQTAEAVIESVAAAETSAQQAGISAEMIHDALKAQTGAIEALAEELRQSRKQAAPVEKPRREAPERPPASAGATWTRR